MTGEGTDGPLLPPPLAFPVPSRQAFHRMFGYHHATHVYADFAPANPDV